MIVEFDEDKQNQRLGELKEREEEDLARAVSEHLELEYADLSGISINMDALRLVPEKEAREANVAAFALLGKKIKLGALSPDTDKVKEIVDGLSKNYIVDLVVVSPRSLEKAWGRYADLSLSKETTAGVLDISVKDIQDFMSGIKTIEDVKRMVADIIKLKRGFRISKILEIVLSGALALDASDVHVEPEENAVRLRFRLDGVLHDILSLDKETFGLLLSRVKLLSGLKLNVKSEAQDGRFSVKIGDTEIEIRTSILPGAYNESIVLRLLNPKSIQVPLEELGIPPKLLGILNKEIDRPNGMVLTTGPTGSGKTTTLYAFLRKIYNPEIKVITIEDPIEYHLNGIVQTQVNNEKNYTFAAGLRSVLRQDPDVIMVGEIRDNETAQIAINSALTGHLVFSTLHTNDAAGSFPRLIDLGVNPRVISSAISIALAQRLVRKLCPFCKKEVVLDGEDKKTVEKIVATIFDKTEVPANNSKIWKSVGCDKCSGTGYKGRTGVYEGIRITEEIDKTIEFSTNEKEIAKAAVPQGILTMSQDGIIKVLAGVTSLDELERVISLDEV